MSFPSLIKPPMLALSPGLVAPEWEWFWAANVLSLPFWENSGSQSFDARLRFISTFQGNVDWGSSERGVIFDCPGSAGDFARVRTVIDGAVSIFQNSDQPFTVSSLAFTNDNTVGQAVWSLSSSASSIDQFALINNKSGTGADGWAALKRASDGTFTPSAFSGVLPNNGEIYHLVCRYVSDSERHIYVNGVNKDTGTITTGAITLTQTAIGRLDDATPNWELNGGVLLCDFFDRDLSDSEIAQLVRDPFGPFHMVDEVGVVIGLPAAAAGRIMSSIAGDSGLAGAGGLAGIGGGLVG